MGAMLAVGTALVAATALAVEGPRAPCPDATGLGEAARYELARDLFDEALTLEAADPEGALARLGCAMRLAERPAIALRMGTIAERLGDVAGAITAYERYLALAGEHAPDRAQLRVRIDALARRRAAAPAPPARAEPPAGDDASLRLAGALVAGAGAVAALAGGALLVAARVRSEGVEDLAPGTTRWDSDAARGELETAETEQAAGITALTVGGVAVAVGVTLWIVAASGEPAREALLLLPFPGGAALAGSF
jgi:tetratricopeptide (TPR) repeat protein